MDSAQPYPPLSAEEAVTRGIAWLDANVPDWRTSVSPNSVDIADAYECVLAQVGDGTYARVAETFFGRLPTEEREEYAAMADETPGKFDPYDHWAALHGFIGSCDDASEYCRCPRHWPTMYDLTTVWREQLRETS